MQQRDDGGFQFYPTDLNNFLGCSHSTILDIRAFTEALKHDAESKSEALLRRKGDEHEAAYLESLKSAGKRVAEISKDTGPADRLRLTKEAMRKGADIVYQAALRDDKWGGFADFLVKVAHPSSLGDFSYEVTDTKLARTPRVKHVIQLGVYSHLLTQLQGLQPAQTHLVLGDNSIASFAVNDCAYYVKHAMRRLEDFAAKPPPESYPTPCAHCESCHWKENCGARWESDDHLSLVANIQRTQIEKLQRAGVRTVVQLAQLRNDVAIPDLNPQVYQRLRAQAGLQVQKRQSGENKYEILPREPGRGFFRLPKPDPGDLFFDMEGDPLHPQGLEYLFGLSLVEDKNFVFRPWWSHNHNEEREAFTQLMEFIRDHLQAHPGAYIYHYNHYETTALKRLACRYAVAEHQMDDLLRRMKFVDLYKVVREALRISEPSYSIKNVEVFYMEKREGDVSTADDSIVAYNEWRETGDAKLLEGIANYNKIDCISTAKLRDWLVSLRPGGLAWFEGSTPQPDAEEVADKVAARLDREARYVDYQERLQRASASGQPHLQHLADLLEFHAREGRPQWWEFFDRQTRFEEELLDDTECIAGMSLISEPVPVKRSLLHSYRYPPQETKRKAGDQVFEVATLMPAGTIDEIDDENLRVDLKRGAKGGPLPASLSIGLGGPINSDALRDAIYRFASDALAGSNNYPALHDILKKASPRIEGHPQGQPIASGIDLLAETVKAVSGLADSYLFVQGPPGAGKTYTSAHVIVEMIRRGKKVGVAANSHKAIHTLLDMIEKVAGECGVHFEGIKKSSAGNAESIYEGTHIRSEEKSENISLTASLLAGSAWLFAHERFDRHLDYLVIDEAGQVSVANVIAMGVAARNIILVGDQMQLGQPIQGVHPGEAGASILDFLLGSHATVSSDRGIFLHQTRRLHKTLCQFVSDAFYEGRLAPVAGVTDRQVIFKAPVAGIGAEGIHVIPVSHAGCSQRSEEEGIAIKACIEQLLGQTFQNNDGTQRAMTVQDILVVSPYNVQVNHLRSVLPPGARVGTVDKFQGQEARVVLVSMATSDAECMPRDIDFLFSANRLNVALSRAECFAVVVASPDLLETPCRTIEQLRLVNKFCHLSAYAMALKPAQ